MTEIQEETTKSEEKAKKQHSLYLKTLNFAIEFGFIIAVPLLAFAYLGKYLDRIYATNNKMFLYIGIVLALATTCLLFIRKIKDIMKDMNQ